MEELIHIQKTFDKVVFIDKKVSNREFEDCVFKGCDFSNSVLTIVFLITRLLRIKKCPKQLLILVP